jgi:hypothetical protein
VRGCGKDKPARKPACRQGVTHSATPVHAFSVIQSPRNVNPHLIHPMKDVKRKLRVLQVPEIQPEVTPKPKPDRAESSHRIPEGPHSLLKNRLRQLFGTAQNE